MAKIDRAREKQALEQERRILQIKKIIASFPDDSKPFKTVSAAAKYVAKRLSEIEGTNVASTTILRNVHYRALINQKFGFAESKPGDKQAALLEALKDRQRKGEIDALEKHVAWLMTENERLSHQLETASIGVGTTIERKSENETIFATLSRVFELIDGYRIDADRCELIDELHEVAIATRRDLPGFFEWAAKEVK